jgi:molecular chaperone GrpE (heat shock protein)
MSTRLFFLLSFLFLGTIVPAQQPVRTLRVVDTLTTEEKKLNNRIILTREVDSIINGYVATLPKQKDEPVQSIVKNTGNNLQVFLSALILLMLSAFFYYYYKKQSEAGKPADKSEEENNAFEKSTVNKKTKATPASLEAKINELKNELYKLSKENDNLNRVIKEYNGIQHEFDTLKHGMLKVYKVRNYPNYDKSKKEFVAMQGVFQTEHSVSLYAYEKFLKPILAIADQNKNAPARTSQADKEKLLDLLVSLSLLYIEYLYLRVNDLSIGGKMVERIKGFEKGNGIDASLLKKLDTEFGSRALVIKLALKDAGLEHRF